MALKVLYKPASELEALTLKALLEESGIKVFLRSYELPWMDGIGKMMRAEWGEISVLEEDLEKAKEILSDFKESQKDKKENERDDSFC